MRRFCICGSGLDSISRGTDSLLDLLFGRGQRIIKTPYSISIRATIVSLKLDWLWSGFSLSLLECSRELGWFDVSPRNCHKVGTN